MRTRARKSELSSGGGSAGSRPAETSNSTNLLVDGSCICSRQGNRMLNRGNPIEAPEKLDLASTRVPTFGFGARRSGRTW